LAAAKDRRVGAVRGKVQRWWTDGGGGLDRAGWRGGLGELTAVEGNTRRLWPTVAAGAARWDKDVKENCDVD
jgi:hypothetical protein